MKKTLLLFCVSAILLTGCSNKNEAQIISNDKPIGGARDENGCLVGAGYSYDNEINACIRNWGLNENQKKAAKIATNYIGKKNGLTVIQVDTIKCPGCFLVKTECYEDYEDINISNWQVNN